jgi:hypothetical protein
VLSVLLRFTDSDYLFGIFKLFSQKLLINNSLLGIVVGGIQMEGEMFNFMPYFSCMETASTIQNPSTTI